MKDCTRWRSFFTITLNCKITSSGQGMYEILRLKNEDIHSFHDTPLVSKWIENDFCENASEGAFSIMPRYWKSVIRVICVWLRYIRIIVPTLSEASNAEPIAALHEARLDNQNDAYLIKHLWILRSTNGKMSQHRWILDQSLKAMKTSIWRIVISNTPKLSPQYTWGERGRVSFRFLLFGFDKCLWELLRIISIWDVRVPSTVVICHHSSRPNMK